MPLLTSTVSAIDSESENTFFSESAKTMVSDIDMAAPLMG